LATGEGQTPFLTFSTQPKDWNSDEEGAYVDLHNMAGKVGPDLNIERKREPL